MVVDNLAMTAFDWSDNKRQPICIFVTCCGHQASIEKDPRAQSIAELSLLQ